MNPVHERLHRQMAVPAEDVAYVPVPKQQFANPLTPQIRLGKVPLRCATKAALP